jgi:ribose/xylose/arabinose/galactoside ABC-type transport system permease subunit
MNGLRAAGMGRFDAIIQGNRDRLRPILMTTLALVAGMAPLALGTGPGAEERRSIAVVVIGGTSVAGGKANVPGVWGAALFLVLLLTMLNTFGFSVGVRLVLTGLIIVGVITAAGGPRSER